MAEAALLLRRGCLRAQTALRSITALGCLCTHIMSTLSSVLQISLSELSCLPSFVVFVPATATHGSLWTPLRMRTKV